MGEVAEFTGGSVPAALRDALAEDNTDLSSGIRGGYSILSIRGSKWHIKADGEETTITNDDGDAVGSLKLVLLKASPNISKNYYPGGYEEGSSEGPSCSSIDGITPDPGGKDVQCASCAVCPQNVYGSRITDAGKKVKACSDSRRIAVIPDGDFKNAVYGGPMLLRIPASSLSNLSMYGKKMKGRGFPYNTIITRASFDNSASFPKLEFNAVRPLTDDEANEIVGLLGESEFADKIEAVLAKDLEIVTDVPAPKEESLFEEPTDTLAVKNVAPVVQAAEKLPVDSVKATVPTDKIIGKPEPSKVPVADDSDDALDDELASILGSLDNLD